MNNEFKKGDRVKVKITESYQPQATIIHIATQSYCIVRIDNAMMNNICKYSELTKI
jgi:hypothetical protein